MTQLLSIRALALVAAIAMPATSRAQQDTTPPHHHHFGHALFRNVNMTQDERMQVRTIHQKYAPQIRTARQSGDHATIHTLRTQQLDEMRAVLTPAQQATFDANRAALRARKKGATSAPAAPASAPVPAPAPSA